MQRRFDTTRQLADLIEHLAPQAWQKDASGDESFSGVTHGC